MKLSELIEKNCDELELRQGDRATITGIPTGYTRLDQITSGFQKANIITICGASGSGKRALAYNFARNAAIENRKHVSLFSLFLRPEETSMRMLCAEARVDSSRIRSGFLSRDDWHKLTNAGGNLFDSNMDIFCFGSDVFNYDNWQCDMIIIDSFQRLKSDDSAPNISQEQISYSLLNRIKSWALLRDIPVIIISSLNDWRIEQRSDKRPRLSDFKYGYSALADMSDVMICVYRDEMYNTDENNPNRGTAEVIVSKQRTGPTGTAVLTFLNSFCRFENLADEPT